MVCSEPKSGKLNTEKHRCSFSVSGSGVKRETIGEDIFLRVHPSTFSIPMSYRSFKVLTVVGVLAGVVDLAFGARIHDDAGTTGMAFLKIGVGARAVAMAGAYTAVAGDQTTSYWNPAGLAKIKGRDVSLMHTQWLQGIRYEYGGLATGNGRRAFSISLAFNSAGELERRTGPTRQPLGTFNVYDVMLGLSSAWSVSNNFDIGITGKFLYEKIYIESASGVAFDAGLLYQTPVTGLNLGLSVRNLGRTNRMREERIKLPKELNLGASYKFSDPFGDILVCLDLRVPDDYWKSIQAGIEYSFLDLFSLRVGYQTGYQERNISAGLGIRFAGWRIDYAWVPYYLDLGDTHRFSLRLEL
ncbi:MAG TPA: PorV/PorQ family protein [Candidatus Latescibacteria bacterium]|nr:PorV/PorQ family protein [Candidatus Latescibacterota bacterium]